MNSAAAGPYATAGAFVGVGQGRFVFATGPRRQGDALGIVRLGGHVEGGKGWGGSGLSCVGGKEFGASCV